MKLLIEQTTLFLTDFLVVIFDQTFNAPVWCLSRVVWINVSKLFNCCKGLPVFVKCIHFFLLSIRISKLRRVFVLSAHLFFHFFLFVELFKKFMKHCIKVCWLFRVPLKSTFFEIFLQFAFSNIRSSFFARLRVTNVFTS
jgi:hypothetical protein